MALVTGFGLSVAFGDQTIFSGADFSIGPKDKIGLIGVNGAGKTTLMRLLTKEIAPAEGTVAIGKDTVIGYMEQHACSGSERSMLDELLTVYQDVIDAEHELEDIARQIDRGTGDVAALTRRQQRRGLFAAVFGAVRRAAVQGQPGKAAAVRRQSAASGRADQPPGRAQHRLAAGLFDRFSRQRTDHFP